MLSGRLVRLIEDHAAQITSDLISDLKENPRTSSYHGLASTDLHARVFNVYHNLGDWLSGEPDNSVEAHYLKLGKSRAIEGVPLSQVIYALLLTKSHLFNYIRRTVLLESAVDLYQLQEFRRLTDVFFDHAIFYATCGYEREPASSLVHAELAHH